MKRNIMALVSTAALLLTLLAQADAAGGAVQITEITASRDSITLRWTACGADYYEVCRAQRRDGVYVQIARTRSTAYIDSGLTQNSAYFYKVRPCTQRGGAVERGAFSAPAGRCCVAVTAAMAEQNRCYRQGAQIRVRGLMLHSVGCAQESGAVFAASWNQPDADVLVHGVIEPGGTVYQLAGWETRCWHCGGSGNDFLIGVEMTEPNELNYTDGAAFTYSGAARRKAMDNYNTAVALFANLCWMFDLDPLQDICSHLEGSRRGIASGHGDPEHLWSGLALGVTMDTFRQDVSRKMQGTYRDRTPPPAAGYTVSADLLNVRSGPGTDYEIVGGLSEGTAVSVCGTQQGGGRS